MSAFDNFGDHDRSVDPRLEQLLRERLLVELNSPIAQTQAIYSSSIAKWQLPKIEPA